MLAQLDDISAFSFKCSHKVTNVFSMTLFFTCNFAETYSKPLDISTGICSRRLELKYVDDEVGPVGVLWAQKILPKALRNPGKQRIKQLVKPSSLYIYNRIRYAGIQLDQIPGRKGESVTKLLLIFQQNLKENKTTTPNRS